MMDDTNSSGGMRNMAPAAPGRASAVPKPPPHPLDGEWYVHLDGEVFGPFTGHQLRDFAQEGRIDAETQAVRLGAETWTRAADDPALVSLFPRAVPAPPPAGPVRAEAGATVVQVTNNIASEPRPQQVVILDPGVAAPKSAGTALILSILIVGLGQLYNGQIGKGILMFFGCILLWFVLLGWIINIWSWVDAYKTAKAMNERYLRNLAAGMIR
ncbi:GYF domain-containing protein [Ancylobacter sp. IITR112]|uniref:GYF domain-containing protein n=1 Tax=Ancylobacter sp. IITR112 TaxID=3138073 RepID=UPI00352B1079